MEKLSKKKEKEYILWKETIENCTCDFINEKDYDIFMKIYEEEINMCKETPKDVEKINICKEKPKDVEKINICKEKPKDVEEIDICKETPKDVDKIFYFTIFTFFICGFCFFNFVNILIYFTGI